VSKNTFNSKHVILILGLLAISYIVDYLIVPKGRYTLAVIESSFSGKSHGRTVDYRFELEGEKFSLYKVGVFFFEGDTVIVRYNEANPELNKFLKKRKIPKCMNYGFSYKDLECNF
jgi:hypothetical protein